MGPMISFDLRFGKRSVFLDALPERLAPEVFHRDVVAALLVADVENGDDVGVSQASGVPRPVDEPLHELRIVREFLMKHLDGDVVVQGLVPGLVNDRDSAVADLFDDFVLFELDHVDSP